MMKLQASYLCCNLLRGLLLNELHISQNVCFQKIACFHPVQLKMMKKLKLDFLIVAECFRNEFCDTLEQMNYN